jgi:hypothetical protein
MQGDETRCNALQRARNIRGHPGTFITFEKFSAFSAKPNHYSGVAEQFLNHRVRFSSKDPR